MICHWHPVWGGGRSNYIVFFNPEILMIQPCRLPRDVFFLKKTLKPRTSWEWNLKIKSETQNSERMVEPNHPFSGDGGELLVSSHKSQPQIQLHPKGRPDLWISQFDPIWVFPKIGVPQNGWFIMELKWKTLLRLMIWGYHYFRKHPYSFRDVMHAFS